MKTILKNFIFILISMSFCFSGFSSHAINEEERPLSNAPSINNARPSVPPVGESNILERMRQLALTSFPRPIILDESLLATPEQHVDFLKATLESAQERVIIVSPFISIWRLNEQDRESFYHNIKSATQRGVKVTVFTDAAFDNDKPNAAEGRQNLVKAQVDLRIIDRLHSKNVIMDDSLITFGSFNWLSAVVNPTTEYARKLCRYETSTILKDESVPTLIQRLMDDLNRIPLIDTQGFHAFYEESSPATEDFRLALRIHKKYATHPLYRLVTEDIMSSHAESGLREGLTIVRVLQETGAPQDQLLQAIKGLTEFHVGDAMEFLEILEVLATINQAEAKRVAEDKNIGILTRIDRSKNFDDLDYIYSILSQIGMKDLANKVEMYIHTGESD